MLAGPRLVWLAMFKEINVIVLLEDVKEGEYEAKAGAMGASVRTYE